MINHIYIKYYRWDTTTGESTPIFGEATWDLDLCNERGLIGVANTNLVIEGDGDVMLASDTGISMSNALTEILPPLSGETIGGSIYDHTWGIFQPLFESSGVEIVVAECLITGTHGRVSRLLPFGSTLEPGQIDTYTEFIEEIDEEDSVVIMPGYIELKTQYNTEYTNQVFFSVISLVKLFSIIQASSLNLTPMSTTAEILAEIQSKLPFVSDSRVDTLPFGSVNLPVPLAIESGIDVSRSITDSRFDNFNLFPQENAKITVWKYNDGQEFYVFLQNPLSESTDIRAVKIEIDIDGLVTLSWLTATDSDLDKFTQIDPSTILEFDSNFAALADNNSNYVNMMSTTAPYDEGFTKHPYTLYGALEKTYGSVFINKFSELSNAPAGITDYSFANYVDGSSMVGFGSVWFMFNSWITDRYSDTIGYLTNMDDDRSFGEGNVYAIWREGYKRIFWVSNDRRTLRCFPAPEQGETWKDITHEPYNYTNSRFMTWSVGLSVFWLNTNYISGEIYTVAPHLGFGDIGFHVDRPDTLYETKYTKYPIYYRGDDNNSYVFMFAKLVGTLGYDVDGDTHWFDGEYNARRGDINLYSYNFRLTNEIPSDMPMNPVFRYDERDRLEIWYYSDSKKSLLCYDWQMNLKYGYKLGVPFENVALGRDKDGRLLMTITTDTQFIFAIHKPSSEIAYTNFDFSDKTIEDVIRDLSRWNFATYWIDRVDGANTLFFKTRYNGEERGQVSMIANTSMSSDNPSDGTQQQPNRELKREPYEKFADKIDVNSFLGSCGSAGLEKSLYEFEYNIGDIFNIELGRRIAQTLYQILAKRREKLYIPLQAFRCQNYDRIQPVDGTNYCVLAQNSDFFQELKTDVEAVQMEDIYQINENIECILSAVFYNPDGWGYNPLNYPECYCNSCNDFYVTFMTGLIDFLTDEWLVADDTAFNIGDSDGLLAQMMDFLYEHLHIPFVADTGITTTLHEALTNYVECSKDECDI